MVITLILIVFIFILFFLNYLAKVDVLGFRCKTKPEVGQKWVLKDKLSYPDFNPDTCESLVKISKLNKKWVKYDMSYTTDNYLEYDVFTRLYRYVKD